MPRSIMGLTPTTQSWLPGPSEPGLGDGVIHVWRVQLSDVSDDMCDLLCSNERMRASRMADPRNRVAWARGRGVLRALLGGYLHADGATLSFLAGAHGKPALAPMSGAHPNATQLSFNLSHSGEVALYAFAKGMAIGVDVELGRQPTNVVALANRVLGAAEAQRLKALDPDDRQREFLRSWVRYEAMLKCLGLGIGGAAAEQHAYVPWVAELDVDIDGAHAALAAETPPHELRHWSWAG
jgi:4'-phosphopantetheinyl transferase